MANWTAESLTRALNLWTKGQVDFKAQGLSINSRTIKPGEIFIALKGGEVDGHDFLEDADNKGAAAFIVNRDPPEFLREKSYFVVPDSVVALSQLAKYARSLTNGKLIAITGSAGKTTTKEWLAEVLAHFGSVVSSPASYNNHLGVPLSVSSLEPETNFGVFEVGMNQPGEIEPLARLVNPDIAIITTITESHIGFFQDLTEIALEKSAIFSGLKPGGTAIINYDNIYFNTMSKVAQDYGAANIISVGKQEGARLRLMEQTYNSANQRTFVEAEFDSRKINYSTALTGDHYIINSLMVLAAIDCLNIDLKEALPYLEHLEPIEGRGKKYTLCIGQNKTIVLIDDSYNAHPSSMRAGLLTLSKTPITAKTGRKIAVLGEMKELGNQSSTLHRELVPYLQQANVDLVFACGPHMEFLINGLPAAQIGGYRHRAEELWPLVLENLEDGDIVFIKGSKTSNVSLLVQNLMATHQGLLNSQLEFA